MIKISHSSQDKKDGTFTLDFHSQSNYYGVFAKLKKYPYKKKGRIFKFNVNDISDLLYDLSELTSETTHVDFSVFESLFKNKKYEQEILKLRSTLEGIDCGVELANGYSLLPFQHTGVQFVKEVKDCIIADKVGLGKTIQSFSACKALYQDDDIQKALVVVPSTLKEKWKKDIKEKGGMDSWIYQGTAEKRKALFEKFMDEDDPLFLIMSYDTLRIDWDNFIKFNNSCCKLFAIVFDEVQRLKNRDSKRSIACSEISKHEFCMAKLGLSATYIETGLQDMFGAMYVIDSKVFGESYMSFVTTYLNIDYMGKIIGATDKGKKLANKKMKLKSIRRRKPDVADQLKAFLPKVNESTIWLDLHKEQKALYNQTVLGVTDKINDMVKKDQVKMVTAITLLGLVEQACLSTEMFNYGKKNKSIKVDTLKEMLPEIIEENKVVIFCRFTKFVDIMERELRKEGIKCIALHGKRKEGAQKNRQKIIDEFSDSEDINVLITSDILAEGVDIPAASYVINTDVLWNPAKMVQRAGRIDRLNQQADNIYIINLLTRSPIEEYKEELIQDRYNLSLEVMDDGSEESRYKRIKFSDIKKLLRKIK
jgi:SNF2 family DNA or RNA helicase